MLYEIFSLSVNAQSAPVSISGMDIAWYEDRQAQELLQSFFAAPDHAYKDHQVSNDFQMVWL